jgi:arabinogalactan oligomer/maltooligosaccharide transport system substrate-binding protein
MYGYPTSAETYALYYNKDLISEDELPATWSDMYEWTKTFNADNPDKYGFVMDVTSMYYTILFTTKGGNRLFGEGGADVSSSYLNTPEAVAGMEEFQKMREVLPLASADCGTDTADGAFAAGTAAMHISGPWNIANFTDAGVNFGIAPLPALTGETTPAASFSGTRVMFVSAYSDHPAEAELFAKFLISEEMQLLRLEITGALPSIDIAVDSEFALGFIAQLDYAFPMPSVPQMSAFWDAAGSASSNIWDGADVQAELDALDNVIVSYTAE